MTSRAVRLLLVCFVATACASSYMPRTNTRDEVRRYVERAAQLVGARGVEACSDFNGRSWKAGDYYIFVTNADTGVTVCHPAGPERVGRNESDVQDANGKYFMREMLTVAKEQPGGGWVEYVWARPGETVPTAKTAFVQGVTGPDGTRYLVGSGGYSMATPAP